MAKKKTVTKKSNSGKTVETLTHDEAKRKNIPTAEYQSVVKQEHLQLKLRVRASLRDALEVAAASHLPPDTANQEAVRRLEYSFMEQSRLEDAQRENAELRETIRRMVDAFDRAIDTVLPDPLREYREATNEIRRVVGR